MIQNRATLHLYLFFLGIVASLTGFLYSRLLLSVGMIVLVVNAMLQPDWKERLQRWWNNRALVLLSTVFLLPLLSGLSSEDTAAWWRATQIRIPLLLLPVAMIRQEGFTRKHFLQLSWCWMLVLLSGVLWSLVQYLQHPDVFNEAYLKAKVMATPAGGDYIRFSMAIILVLLLWLHLEWKGWLTGKAQWLMRLLALVFIIYLHILGSKTGWLGLYAFVFPIALLTLWRKKQRMLVVLVLSAAIAIPWLSYQYVPTIRNRIGYIRYDFDLYSQNAFVKGQSDGYRVLSWKAGWQVFQEHWVAGVGFGNIKPQLAAWHRQHDTVVQNGEVFLSNEWLIMACGAGIAGFLFFSIAVLALLFSKPWRSSVVALAALFFFLLTFLYENTLSIQLGAFLYPFAIMWWYRLLQEPELKV